MICISASDNEEENYNHLFLFTFQPRDNEEEENCDHPNMPCDNGMKCVKPEEMCNGGPYCQDGMDERPIYCSDL